MEWNVKNAINRDVERQHLNKILKDIARAIGEVKTSSGGTGGVKDQVGEMVTGNRESGIQVTYDPSRKVLDFAVASFTLRLAGDVTGTATVNSLGTMTINTTIDPSSRGLGDVPQETGLAYWRRFGRWEAVPTAVESLDYLDGTGLIALDVDGAFVPREIEGLEDQVVVIDGDGLVGNPIIGLAEVEDSGEGSALVKITRDEFGRVAGTEDATTDDLPEGTNNLYYTQERVEDVVVPLIEDAVDGLLDFEELKEALVAGANVTLTADDVAGTITITATGGGGGGSGSVDTITGGAGVSVDNTDPANPVVSLNTATQDILQEAILSPYVPTDGDILEFDIALGHWVPKKDPKQLFIDGGNF